MKAISTPAKKALKALPGVSERDDSTSKRTRPSSAARVPQIRKPLKRPAPTPDTKSRILDLFQHFVAYAVLYRFLHYLLVVLGVRFIGNKIAEFYVGMRRKREKILIELLRSEIRHCSQQKQTVEIPFLSLFEKVVLR